MKFDPNGFNAKKLKLLADAEAFAEEHLGEQCAVFKHETHVASSELVADLKRRAADKSKPQTARRNALALMGLAYLAALIRSETTDPPQPDPPQPDPPK